MTFRPDKHQLRAVREFLRGSYMLVWEPGVGKTWPVIEAAATIRGQTLCIVPAHLRDQWHEACQKFAPELAPCILENLDSKIEESTFLDSDFLICSYEYVSHVPRWKQLRGRKWMNIAIDEAHYLIRQSATRTVAILGAKRESPGALVRATEATWLLTGTPFTFPNEIYPILSRVFPTAIKRTDGTGLMTAREWENQFCVVETTRFGEKVVNAKNVRELRRRLAPVLDKVRISEVHPGGNVTDVVSIRGNLSQLTRGLDPELLDRYEALRKILEDDEIPDSEKLAELDNSGLDMAQLRHNIALAKVTPTVEMVRFELEAYPGKVCVYGWHREPLKALAASLKAPLIFGGITPKAKRDALTRFQNDPRCRVLCGQIGAIGTGTDGLQHSASRGIFMEASWRYLENKQVVHRLFRRGQLNDTYHTLLSLHGSVDDHVARVLKRNADIISRALD